MHVYVYICSTCSSCICTRTCMQTLKYTTCMYTHVLSSLANWDGISDPESGIHSYGWCIGTSVGSCNVMPFLDPFPSYVNQPGLWTNMGVAIFQTALQDGTYYVSVQAINNAVYGGAMATIFEHSTPYVLDTSPPLVQFLSNGLAYNASSNQLSLTYLTM